VYVPEEEHGLHDHEFSEESDDTMATMALAAESASLLVSFKARSP